MKRIRFTDEQIARSEAHSDAIIDMLSDDADRMDAEVLVRGMAISLATLAFGLTDDPLACVNAFRAKCLELIDALQADDELQETLHG